MNDDIEEHAFDFLLPVQTVQTVQTNQLDDDVCENNILVMKPGTSTRSDSLFSSSVLDKAVENAQQSVNSANTSDAAVHLNDMTSIEIESKNVISKTAKENQFPPAPEYNVLNQNSMDDLSISENMPMNKKFKSADAKKRPSVAPKLPKHDVLNENSMDDLIDFENQLFNNETTSIVSGKRLLPVSELISLHERNVLINKRATDATVASESQLLRKLEKRANVIIDKIDKIDSTKNKIVATTKIPAQSSSSIVPKKQLRPVPQLIPLHERNIRNKPATDATVDFESQRLRELKERANAIIDRIKLVDSIKKKTVATTSKATQPSTSEVQIYNSFNPFKRLPNIPFSMNDQKRKRAKSIDSRSTNLMPEIHTFTTSEEKQEEIEKFIEKESSSSNDSNDEEVLTVVEMWTDRFEDIE